MTYQTLRLDRDGYLLTVTLNRPESGNALNTQMLEEFVHLMAGLYVDPGQVRAVLVTGAGPRIFCAGGDLKERKGMTDAAWRRQHALTEQLMRHILECPIPIIGAVNGAAIGGGCELIAAFDFAYASTSASFALTEVALGIHPGAMGTQLLPRAIGVRRAREVILSAKRFSAQDALDWGLINRLCAPEDLLPEATAIAQRICGNAPIAVAQAKKAIGFSQEVGPVAGYRFELETYYRTIPTEDRLEGILAFNEKRAPNFKGR